MKVTLVYQDAKSHKFWRVRTDGSSLVTEWGRVGTNGQSKTKSCASKEAAEAEANKLAKKKRAKGYVDDEGGGAKKPSAKKKPTKATKAAEKKPAKAAKKKAAKAAKKKPAGDKANLSAEAFGMVAAKRVFAAARRGQRKKLESALDRGLSPDAAVDTGWGPRPLLHELIDADQYELAQLLLERGAKPEVRDGYKRTPLHTLVGKEGTGALINQLLSLGADVEARGNSGGTPLMAAIAEHVPRLLAAGADIEAQDKAKRTAYAYGAPDVRDVLRAAGAKGFDKQGSVLTPKSKKNPKLDEIYRIECIGTAPDGAVWVGSYAGFYRIGTDGVVRYNFAESFSPDSFVVGRNGAFYFGTNWGLLENKAGVWKLFTPQDSELHNQHLVLVRSDNEGDIYCCGYNEPYVSVFDGENFRLLRPGSDLPADYEIKAMAFDANNHMLLGSDDGGARMWDGKAWKEKKKLHDHSLGDPTIYDIAVDGDDIWFGCIGGIVRLRGGKYEHFNPDDVSLVQDLLVRDDGIWATGYYDGIFRLKDGEFVYFREEEHDALEGDVQGMALDGEGRLWLHTDDKLAVYDDGVFSRVGGALPRKEREAEAAAAKKKRKKPPFPAKPFLPRKKLPPSVVGLAEEAACDAIDAARLMALIKPAAGFLFEKKSKKLSTGASKFGGLPDLPKSLDWPTYPYDEDMPLPFVLQIALEDVAPHDLRGLLPKKGFLYFFCDTQPDDIGGARVLYYSGAASKLAARALPEDLELRKEDSDFIALVPQFPLRFFQLFTAPTRDYFDERADLDEDALDALGELPEKLRALSGEDGAEFYSQLLGWPDTLQGDIVEGTSDVLLLQLFGHGQSVSGTAEIFEHWCGDGLIHFIAALDDVEKKRFGDIDASMVYT